MAPWMGLEKNMLSKTLPWQEAKTPPMVDFISYMPKQFGDNQILGEEFMRAVVETQWSKTTMRPLTKGALTATTCTSMKHIDGVA